jgi:hypothetical protein
VAALAAVAGLGLLGVGASGRLAAQGGNPDAMLETPVGGTIQMDNACYARLPDMPAGRYGGFGGYNPDTGVLFYAGGAEKRTAENTIAFYQLYGVRLDGTMSGWNTINYSANVGYLRETDRGCREMASVQIAPDRWVSVGGKDGCDGDADRKGGDIKEIVVGASADSTGVRWVPNSQADRDSLPTELADEKFKLLRLFAAWDGERNRIVFGQGTFDDEKDSLTQDETYQAVRRGSIWNVSQLRPTGQAPSRRFGTCAAHVFQEDTGVDGLLVLGGQQGGTSGTTSYKEVWWLDFSKSPQGEWTEITSRFANMDEIGYRREGACAYNPDTKVFYSWMGRASSSIPDGASRSSGAWMVDLAQLGDTGAQLTWQRLAKDKADDPKGRHLLPSVYDAQNNRFFAIGGRNDLDEWQDVWAIYPGVTGTACANLDVYAPFRPSVTPTTPAPGTPTTPAPGTPTTRTPTSPPTTPPPPPAEACAYLSTQVPAQAIADAIANPASVRGYQMLCNPNVAPSPFNTVRSRLSMQNPAKPYHPLFNALVWSCGCP